MELDKALDAADKAKLRVSRLRAEYFAAVAHLDQCQADLNQIFRNARDAFKSEGSTP